MRIRFYICAIVGLTSLGLYWVLSVGEYNQGSRPSTHLDHSNTRGHPHQPSLLADSGPSPARWSTSKRAVAALLNPRMLRQLTTAECIGYLNQFGWDAERVAAAYYLTYSHTDDYAIFMDRLVELADSDVSAALMVALHSDDLDQRISAARNLQDQQPDNALGYLLEASALLSSAGRYSDAIVLVETTLEMGPLDLLLETRTTPIREAYEFVGLSPESVLTHTLQSGTPVAAFPSYAITELGKGLAELTPEDPVEHATIQIHLSQLLRSVLEGDAQSSQFGTFPIEGRIQMSELTALQNLPEDTLYGDGVYTVGDRIAELASQRKTFAQMVSKVDSRLREASDEVLRDFLEVWKASGSRAAMEFVADQ